MAQDDSSVPKLRKKRTSVVIGEKYGRLTAVCEDQPHQKPSGIFIKKFKCLCDCGVEVSILGQHLTRGDTKSCGCFRNEQVRASATTHGLSKHELYPAWLAMCTRCENTSQNGAENYNGRGISVCQRWKTPDGVGFSNFVEDMGDRPHGCTLERIDNSLGYSPENCKWETRGRQNYNKRRHRNNRTGRTGVTLRPDGRYIARIGVSGVSKVLGYFLTFEEAVAEREKAELLFYGFVKE